jgi:hypothetical protein
MRYPLPQLAQGEAQRFTGKMRHVLRLLPFIMAITAGMALAQTVQRSISFGISVPNDTVKVGSPIIIKIQEKNISDHDIWWMSLPGGNHHGEVIGFRPIIKDTQGKEPPLTKWGREVFGRTAPGEPNLVLNAVGQIAVQPGEVMRTEINLNGLYDLSPGKYAVQVWTYDDENKEQVMSKRITVTVVP